MKVRMKMERGEGEEMGKAAVEDTNMEADGVEMGTRMDSGDLLW